MDIFRECFTTKNFLEKKLRLNEIQIHLNKLRCSLRTLSQKRSVFCDLFSQYWHEAAASAGAARQAKATAFGIEVDDAEISTPHCLEEVLAIFAAQGRDSLRVRWQQGSGGLTFSYDVQMTSM